MTDYTELKRLVDRVLTDRRFCGDENHKALADGVLALIAENESLKGPHDWLAEDLIKELVDNAQAIQENADDGEDDPFVIVLLASASRIRRQEANIDKLRAENEQLAKTADCWDRLNILNKALSDSFRVERDQLKADNERLRADYAGLARFNPEWDRVAAAQDLVREHMAMVVQLKAEVAGLKTGYEAYERVNAELKAEVEGLRKDSTRLDRLDQEREAYGTSFHEGNRWTLDGQFATVRDAIDAALGQGEQS
ncbi:hypothetical protein [Pseudomonas sp. PSPC3-3]|uniref:hypothetical protein n=1 Tax=unclassified Pseudomonas TaxID=196821 RepID=UPI003CFA77A6